jgi:predicted transcriptional regulator
MSIRLPDDLYERLRRAAFEERAPMNGIVVEALEAHLSQRESAMAAPERGH